MQTLSAEVRSRLEAIAVRHGVSPGAAEAVLQALAAGSGAMAQFNHPELGGMGQWSPGMVMVGDMFDHGLKQRVDALCTDLAALLRDAAPASGAASAQAQSQGMPGAGQAMSSGSWWPAELGAAGSSGAQNDMRYAYFPGTNRLAVQQGGRTSLYDTTGHRILGASQQQGGGQSLAFSTDRGSLRLEELRRVDAGDAPGQTPAQAGAAGSPDAAAGASAAGAGGAAPELGGDPLAAIERLAALQAKGVVTAEEFAAKKAELLKRL